MADNDMHRVHALLIQLQDVLGEKFVLEEEIDSLPANLKDKEERLAVAQTRLRELEEALDAAKQEATSNAIKYDDAFRHRAESEKMMETITVQREYEALTKQIDEARVVENALLKARAASNAQVDQLTETLEAQRAVCDSLAAEVGEEKQKIDGIIAEKKAAIVELDAKCSEIRSEGLSDDIYAKFSKIVKNKNGVGVAPIVQGQVCDGCHMILPMQFVNDVREGKNLIEYCPYCSRILYYQESEEQIDLSGFEGEGGEDIFAEAIAGDLDI